MAACDQAPGPAAEAGEPPLLSEFSFSPHRFQAAQEGEDLTIPLTMEVTATDPDGDLETVSYVVQSPIAGERPVAAGTLSSAGGARFAGQTDLSIPPGEVGVYTVLLFAVDREGMLSNDVRGMLRVEGIGEPPRIVAVVAPDTVARPAAGEPPKRIPLVAEVTDPDGLSNINTVRFWNVANPSARIEMFDDGESGDETAGDGRYTRVVEISSGNQPGTNVFAFQAVDRSGLTSDTVEKSIVVE